MSSVMERLARERRILKKWERIRAVHEDCRRLFWLGQTIIQDLSTPASLTLRQTLRAWTNGFMRFHFQIYGLDRGGKAADFLSDIDVLKTARINGRHVGLINNKLAFAAMMTLHGLPCPRVLGLIRRGVFYPLDASDPFPAGKLPELLAGPRNRLVIKPNWGYHGRGFMLLARDESGHRLNGEEISPAAIEPRFRSLDDFIVTEFVAQGEYGAGLFPGTTNSIRMVIFRDPGDGQPFIARAAQRIGTSRSYPVDNFIAGRGGLSAAIDVDTGRLGPGALVSGRNRVEWHDRHPETAARIRGIEVPAWPEICRRMLEWCRRLSFAPCIGWDIVITRDGFSIIEGNSTPGMTMLQVHGPMLADPRVRRFYRHWRVIA